jgi:putative endonuclease
MTHNPNLFVIAGLTRNPAYLKIPHVTKEQKNYYVYIMANKRNGTIYTGVTDDLVRRVHEHRNDLSNFTRRYKLHMLVYYEQTNDVNGALQREEQLKNWHRSWKMELIEGLNPEWKDLWEEISV